VPPAAPTAAQIRAAAWMAIIGDATAIGHRGFEGFADVKLAEGAEAGLKRLNDQITRLGPAILAAPAKAKVEMSLAGAAGSEPLNLPKSSHFKVTELDGTMYVFAQSLLSEKAGDLAKARATFSVAGLKAGTKVEVVDENRAITASDGQFVDDFAPLAEHIYKIK
jgi:hypothetical protein